VRDAVGYHRSKPKILPIGSLGSASSGATQNYILAWAKMEGWLARITVSGASYMADGSVKSFKLSQGEGVAERIPWVSASRRARCTRFVLFTAANRRDDAMSSSSRLPLERSQPTGDLVEILDP
jgi:hypothetical protein